MATPLPPDLQPADPDSRSPLGRFGFHLATLLATACFISTASRAAEKVTYDDQILPILRNRCLKCHNGDKIKAGLNLEKFDSAIKGSNNGPVLNSGDPDGSLLLRVILHAEEPTMPPNDKLPDAEIDVVRQWIAGGLLQNAGSKAIVSKAPKIDLTLAAGALGRPEGPPPMPVDVFALDPYVQTERTSVSTALAASPWAPLVAIGGQHQVLLYHSDTLQLLGVIPFPDAFPYDVKFSANGKLLIIGGGRSAQNGRSVVWDITTGERVISVSDDELDAVLTTDISPDQRFIAHGGPDRLVRIYSTRTGSLRHRIKKHTDWVTAVRFSPDGRYLATGDRNGGIHVWETAVGKEACTLPGHGARVAGFAWAATNVLVSAGEDGVTTLWDINEVKEIKKWTAHNGGVLALNRSSDGLLVTCGRNQRAALWDANGGRKREFEFPGDLPSRAAVSHDGKRIIGSDWSGAVYVWDAESGQEAGRLSLNPPTAEQGHATALASLQSKQSELDAALASESAAATAAQGARDRMASLRRQADEAEKEARRLEAHLKELTATLEKLGQTSESEPGAEAAVLQEKIAETRGALERATVSARQAAESAKAAESGPLAEEIEQTAKAFSARQADVEAARAAATLALTDLEAWNRKVAFGRFFAERAALLEMRATQETFQAQADLSQSAIAALQTDLDAAGLAAEQSQAEARQGQAERAAAHEAVQEKLSALQTDWRRQTNRWHDVGKDLTWAREQSASLNQQLGLAEEALRAAAAALSALKSQQTALAERVTAWETELQARQEDGGLLKRDMDAQQSALNDAANALNAAAAKAAELQTQSDRRMAELKELLTSESRQFEERRAALEVLKPKMEAAQSRVDELEQAYRNLKPIR